MGAVLSMQVAEAASFDLASIFGQPEAAIKQQFPQAERKADGSYIAQQKPDGIEFHTKDGVVTACVFRSDEARRDWHLAFEKLGLSTDGVTPDRQADGIHLRNVPGLPQGTRVVWDKPGAALWFGQHTAPTKSSVRTPKSGSRRAVKAVVGRTAPTARVARAPVLPVFYTLIQKTPVEVIKSAGTPRESGPFVDKSMVWVYTVSTLGDVYVHFQGDTEASSRAFLVYTDTPLKHTHAEFASLLGFNLADGWQEEAAGEVDSTYGAQDEYVKQLPDQSAYRFFVGEYSEKKGVFHLRLERKTNP